MHAGVSLDVAGGVATIELSRPAQRNALRLAEWLGLRDAVAAADADPNANVIVLRGVGGVFGAGNDIAAFGALHGDPAAAMAFARAMADAMRALELAAKPVVIAIEGFCYGASVALALAGDVRIAAADATFAITPAKLGALYLQSDLHRLAAAVGAGQAKRMIYTARTLGAEQALAIGLIDELAPAGTFDAALVRLTEDIRRGSRFTLRQSKAMLRTARDDTPPETAASLAAFVAATQGSDFHEGVSAFLAKRPPRF